LQFNSNTKQEQLHQQDVYPAKCAEVT